jgi:hypothetical protein
MPKSLSDSILVTAAYSGDCEHLFWPDADDKDCAWGKSVDLG